MFSRVEHVERAEFAFAICEQFSFVNNPDIPLCVSYENICQYAKSLWRFPLQSRLLDVSLSPIRNVGRLSVKA